MTQKKTKAIRVPLSQAEPVRRQLRDRNLLRDDVKIAKGKTDIYFPLKDSAESLPPYPITSKSFEIRTKKPKSFKDILLLPKKHMENLPTSYDIVGGIILIKLPKTLLKYQDKIGKALLQTHANIHTVCVIGPVRGELRTRTVSIVAGKKQTQTTHKEYGLTFDVDVATTYFSPRLASERKRIAGLVKTGEIIVDLFTGVAPFAITIARYAQPKIVYAIDKNPQAIRLAEQNVKQNHVLQTVEIIHADATDAPKLIPGKADRIIMNLPFSAFEFFPVALSIAAETSRIHYYDIIREEDIDARISALKELAKGHGYGFTDVSIHKIKSYAPREFYIGVDITATKHADVA